METLEIMRNINRLPLSLTIFTQLDCEDFYETR